MVEGGREETTVALYDKYEDLNVCPECPFAYISRSPWDCWREPTKICLVSCLLFCFRSVTKVQT